MFDRARVVAKLRQARKRVLFTNPTVLCLPLFCHLTHSAGESKYDTLLPQLGTTVLPVWSAYMPRSPSNRVFNPATLFVPPSRTPCQSAGSSVS